MSTFPGSIRTINRLPEDEKREIYSTLIPDWIYTDYGIDRETHEYKGHAAIQMMCATGTRALEISVRRDPTDRDPLMYLHMVDTFNNQLLVLLIVMNDPDSPRFNTDIDSQGNQTNFGTTARNIPAEIAAMKAGLAPGQIRKGLRSFKRVLPIFETFVDRMGHDLFLIEPLAYHNAIVFERYGFNYMRGLKDMRLIHEGFQPQGELYRKLTPVNPFRQLDAWQTVRKRAWAIHDGILGHPFTGFQMYKRIGYHAGIETFPNSIW